VNLIIGNREMFGWELDKHNLDSVNNCPQLSGDNKGYPCKYCDDPRCSFAPYYKEWVVCSSFVKIYPGPWIVCSSSVMDYEDC